MEHIVPCSQGGDDALENLALACRSCNLRKGIHIRAIDPESGEDIPLFHPRSDDWAAHFRLNRKTSELIGATDIGRATVSCLDMNSKTQTTARDVWQQLGLFP